MGSNGASNNGSNDTQVSGYEREIEKQKAKEKAQKEAFKQYSKENLNPTDNTQTINKNKQNLAEHERMMRENRGGNQVVQAPKVISPTTAEVSQAAPEVTAEEARASANELILKKRKGRGRSLTILTSAQGVQDNKGLTLGKPSLLG